MRNVRRAVSELDPEVRVEREHGMLVVEPSRRAGDVERRMRDVFGIATLSLARSAESDLDAIARRGGEVVAEALDGFPRSRRVRFRVSTRRSDKRFPLTSREIDREVADRLPPELWERMEVDLGRPELELGVQVRRGTSFVFAERVPGAGGLPVGTVGRVVVLLSGGIDSPVAAWMAMKRGCEAVLLSFHSRPWVGEGFERKVERLARVLSRFQPRTRLVLAPLAEIQMSIKELAPPPYRTVLYRRMMQRLAARLAREERAGAIVTGEALGQVASQTLENLALIEEAADLPVLRPLVAFDKTEAIALARRIGTYDVSIENEPDCCTVFQPERPVIRGRLAECQAVEANLDVEGLIEASLSARRVVDV
jgi:thiamine biosynthesis protein ThiI